MGNRGGYGNVEVLCFEAGNAACLSINSTPFVVRFTEVEVVGLFWNGVFES